MSSAAARLPQKRVGLIDLSAIFRAKWHASEHDDVSAAYTKTLAAVAQCAAGYDAVAICIDKPPYKRRDIFAGYKAHREKAPAAMYEQLDAVVSQLDRDGFHIVGAQGYEADDIIATLTGWAEKQGHAVYIHSADKDLMQLVSPSTRIVSIRDRQEYDWQGVEAKWGVPPPLIADLLALCGDAADNIPGIAGVGPKTAAAWLNSIGPLEAILQNPDALPERFREAVRANKDGIALSWRLAQLMTDAPIKPEIIMSEKPKAEAAKQEPPTVIPEDDGPELVYQVPASAVQTTQTQTVAPTTKPGHLSVVQPQQPAPPPAVEWEKALEPRSLAQAQAIAKTLYESRLFGDFPNPQAILAIVMTGRSLGMDTVASLRGFHLIKGRACPSAQLLVGLVKRASVCEWFRLVESTDKSATWETKRRDEPKPTSMTFTIEMARSAGLAGNDQWQKRPMTMLRWRAAVELARAVYPDITAGLYAAEEMEEV
jgi:5'-3' exonuclease